MSRTRMKDGDIPAKELNREEREERKEFNREEREGRKEEREGTGELQGQSDKG